MTVFAQVKIDEQSFRQAEQFMLQLPLELRNKVIDPALRAAAKPVEQRAKQLAPDSVKSGSRKKWSKKVKASRASTKQHKDTIGHSSLRKYSETLTAIYVGPLWPAGNLINIIGHPHQQTLWVRQVGGREVGRTGKTLPATDYLQQAAEQTAAQQQSAFVEKVRTESDRLLKEATS